MWISGSGSFRDLLVRVVEFSLDHSGLCLLKSPANMMVDDKGSGVSTSYMVMMDELDAMGLYTLRMYMGFRLLLSWIPVTSSDGIRRKLYVSALMLDLTMMMLLIVPSGSIVALSG